MGLVTQDPWSTDEVLSTPFFPQIMVGDKFFTINIFFTCVTMTVVFQEDKQAITQFNKSWNSFQCRHGQVFKHLDIRQ